MSAASGLRPHLPIHRQSGMHSSQARAGDDHNPEVVGNMAGFGLSSLRAELYSILQGVLETAQGGHGPKLGGSVCAHCWQGSPDGRFSTGFGLGKVHDRPNSTDDGRASRRAFSLDPEEDVYPRRRVSFRSADVSEDDVQDFMRLNSRDGRGRSRQVGGPEQDWASALLAEAPKEAPRPDTSPPKAKSTGKAKAKAKGKAKAKAKAQMKVNSEAVNNEKAISEEASSKSPSAKPSAKPVSAKKKATSKSSGGGPKAPAHGKAKAKSAPAAESGETQGHAVARDVSGVAPLPIEDIMGGEAVDLNLADFDSLLGVSAASNEAVCELPPCDEAPGGVPDSFLVCPLLAPPGRPLELSPNAQTCGGHDADHDNSQ